MAWALFVLVPNVAAGQTAVAPESAGQRRERLTVQIAAGPTLVDRGNVMSVAFGYLPAPWLELLLNSEFDRMSLRFERVRGANTAVRGGTMSFVSVEMRAALPADLVSPFAGSAAASHARGCPNVAAKIWLRLRPVVAFAFRCDGDSACGPMHE
jgi:hypothetical protein